MILNVSGRTDVVAFYTEWFINRYEEGYLDVRNPFYQKMVSRISFDNVDAIMFCTKNPIPILDYLPKIDKPIIFHITLTPYKKDIEPDVSDKSKIIEGIKSVSEIVGIDNVYVRYDPVFISDVYNLEYHKRAFEKVCSLLEGYVNKLLISFIDDYKNVRKNLHEIKYRPFTSADYKFIGENFSKSAREHGMTVQTCFEEKNLTEYGFIKGECLSHEMAFKLTGKKYKSWNARRGGKCGCVEMVDVGVYNTCRHFCKYCYANYDEKQVKNNSLKHNPTSSLLIGELENDDIIKERIK